MQWSSRSTATANTPGLAFETWVDTGCIVVAGVWTANPFLLLHAATRNQLTLDLVVHALRQHALAYQLVL